MSLQSTYQSRKELLVENLETMGVTGYSSDDGLTTLINAVLEIAPVPPTPTYDGISDPVLIDGKNILSYADVSSGNEFATLQVQLLDGQSPALVSGETVSFYRYVDGVSDVLLGSDVTDSNGQASFTYGSSGFGDLGIYAKIGTSVSEIFVVRDAIKYIPNTLTSSQSLTVPNIPTNFKCIFKVEPYTITSTPSNTAWLEIGSDANNFILLGNTGSYGNIGIFVRVNGTYVINDSVESLSAQNWQELTYTYEDGVQTITDGNKTVTLTNSQITARSYVYFRCASSNKNPIKEILFLPL